MVGIGGRRFHLPPLRQMEKDDTMMGSGEPRVRVMPAVSISHAARTAIDNSGSAGKVAEGQYSKNASD